MSRARCFVVPSLKAHIHMDYILLGRSYRKIHKEMDKHFKKLGHRHRILFQDPVSANTITQRLYPHDPVAVQVALFQIYLDEICSLDPEFKKILKAMAILHTGKKRRKRKSTRTLRKTRNSSKADTNMSLKSARASFKIYRKPK